MTVDTAVRCWCSEMISRSTLKVVWGQRDTRRDRALGMTLQKLSSPFLSLHCLWPCVPSGLVCGVNTLLSNALLSRPEAPPTNCLMIGVFVWPTGKINTVDYINSWPWFPFNPVSQTCFVYLFYLLSPSTLLTHIPLLTRSQVFQKCLFSLVPALSSSSLPCVTTI